MTKVSNVSKLERARGPRISRISTYVSIGFALYGAFGIARQFRTARGESDTLKLVDSVVRAAAVVTGVAVLTRELRDANSDDILAG